MKRQAVFGALVAAPLTLPFAGAEAADTQTILHAFAGTPDGASPDAGLAPGTSGIFSAPPPAEAAVAVVADAAPCID